MREFERQGGDDPLVVWAIAGIDATAAKAVPALGNALDDHYSSAAINAALFRVRGKKGDLDAIVQLLRHPSNRDTRRFAAEVRDKLGADAAPVTDDVRVFLDSQGNELSEKDKEIVDQLRRYLDKVKSRWTME